MSEADKVRKITEALKAALKEVNSRENMEQLGTEIAERVRLRTRLGKGVAETGGPAKPLKELSKKYVKHRKVSDLYSETTASKSNLTFTGQLLDSLVAKVIKQGEVEIKPSGTRRKGLTNEKLAQYVSEAGRPFLNLSKPEIKSLSEKIRDLLVEKLNSVLKS